MSLSSRIYKLSHKLRSLAEKSGRNKIWLLNDYCGLRINYAVSLNEYSNFKLYKTDSELRKDFLSYRMAEKYWEILNPRNHACLARDKFLTHCLLESVGIPTAKLIAYYDPEAASESNTIGYKYDQILKIIIDSEIDSFVIKPAKDSAHGHGVVVCRELIKREDNFFLKKYNGEEIELRQLLGTSPMLFEKMVVQSEQFRRFNESSLNTVRIMTALYPDSSVKIIASFIKIGRCGSDVDNAGIGGNVDCGIDSETGILYNAIQFNSWDDIVKIDRHPDSGMQLVGTKIEGWHEIIDKLKYYQGLLPQLKTIGWDVAITKNGPVIIEINNWWDTTGQAFINKGWAKAVKDCYEAWALYLNR